MYSQRKRYYSIIAWLLLAVYLLNPFRTIQPILNYQVNYQYISTILCENKDKPELSCKGKCYLKKELAKTTEEQSKEIKFPTKVETVFLTNTSVIITPFVEFKAAQHPIDYSPDLLNRSHKITSPPPKG